MKRIYFDAASTTPLRKEILKSMLPYLFDNFGNPSSLHFYGQEAIKAIDESREKIKKILNADLLREIIFTSSATESNNLAIKGLVFYYYFFKNFKPHIITSSIEHPSIIEVFADLEDLGLCETTYIKPEKNSLIDLEKLKNSVKDNTILISIHYVNSELGTIQKLNEIAKLIRELNQNRKNKIYFHTDAAQAGFENLNVKELGIDLMTLSSHKIYGPKGIGLLYCKFNLPIVRLISGSTQEHGLRASTEAVFLIVGLAEAMDFAFRNREKINIYLKKIRDYFLFRIKDLYDKIIINSNLNFSTPKIINVFFPTKSAQELLIYLDQHNIAVSAGIACQSRANEPSYVVKDIYGNERSKKSLRISFGIYNNKKEVDYLIYVLKKIL